MLSRLVRSLAPALVLGMLSVASYAGISVGVSINLAPPPLPIYVQPPPPAVDYIWTPGYWAYGPDGYYWIPGTWVLAPEPGLLWTPGYWAWEPSGYLWHSGYWGPHVGFYGGVNYGFGYSGVGYAGGYWRGGHVVYNRAVTNVRNINVYNVYERPVVRSTNRVSFNGGHGGINARPDAAQLAVAHDRHFDPTPLQRRHFEMAARDRNLRAAVNHGRPGIAATERPASFSGRGVTGSRAVGGDARYGAADGTFRGSHSHAVERPSSVTHDHAGAGDWRSDRPPEAQRQAMQQRQMQQRPPESRQTYQRQSQQQRQVQQSHRMQQAEQRPVQQRMRQQPEQRQVERQQSERRAAPGAGATERAQIPRGNAGERRGGNGVGRQEGGRGRSPEQAHQTR